MTAPAPVMPVTEAELHAWIDRQLTPERAAEIERWLAQRPEESARVRSWGTHKRELRELFDPLLLETVPAPLRHAAQRRRAWFLQALAAGATAVLLAGGAGWTLRGAIDRPRLASAAPVMALSDGSEFAARAALAHAVYAPESRRPVEVDADHEEQLVAWLSRRLGAPMKAPHLQAVGYALEGGRLLPGDSGPVAQFMYRDASGQRLTLYVSNEASTAAAGAPGTSPPAAPADVAFRFAREGALNVFYWVDGPFAYAITAQADRAALTRVSDAVYRQLSPER